MSIVIESEEVDFERRWTAWKARGLAHERLIRRRMVVFAVVMAAMVIVSTIAYGLLWQ